MSQEQEEEAVITEDGQIVPRDPAERMAAEREADRDDDEEEDDPTFKVGVEDEQEEANVKVRRAPKKPTQEERRRHEATHLPYRSW